MQRYQRNMLILCLKNRIDFPLEIIFYVPQITNMHSSVGKYYLVNKQAKSQQRMQH